MRNRIVGLLLVLGLAFASIACESELTQQNREAGKAQERAQKQANVDRNLGFEQAQRLYQAPKNQNFPLRQALVEFTERQDLLNHPWYIYILGVNGNPIGYFVGKTYPINACNFLSSTEGNLPSLDGIYYGGSGASGACTAVFFFDAATNAMQVIDGLPYFVSDSPLSLNVQPILVQGR